MKLLKDANAFVFGKDTDNQVFVVVDHESVTKGLLGGDKKRLGEIVGNIVNTLAGEPVFDNSVFDFPEGRVLLRRPERGRYILYAAMPRGHENKFTEATNRTRIDHKMLKLGYVPCHPALDVGVDTVYYRETDGDIRAVQQKSRVGIWKKYIRRNIWIAFPEGKLWYMYPHDELVEHCEAEGRWVGTRSWRDKGEYYCAKVPKWLRLWIERWGLYV